MPPMRPMRFTCSLRARVGAIFAWRSRAGNEGSPCAPLRKEGDGRPTRARRWGRSPRSAGYRVWTSAPAGLGWEASRLILVEIKGRERERLQARRLPFTYALRDTRVVPVTESLSDPGSIPGASTSQPSLAAGFFFEVYQGRREADPGR